MTSIFTKNQNKTSQYPYSTDNINFQNLVEHANNQTKLYCEANSISNRKLKGHIFTPPKIASSIAGLFTSQNNKIKILDPGAGTGILVAAICGEHNLTVTFNDEILILTAGVLNELQIAILRVKSCHT